MEGQLTKKQTLDTLVTHRGTEICWHSPAFTSGLLLLQMPEKLIMSGQGSEQATHFAVLGLDVWFLVLCPADRPLGRVLRQPGASGVLHSHCDAASYLSGPCSGIPSQEVFPGQH